MVLQSSHTGSHRSVKLDRRSKKAPRCYEALVVRLTYNGRMVMLEMGRDRNKYVMLQRP